MIKPVINNYDSAYASSNAERHDSADMSSATPIRHISDTALWVAVYRAQESERADAVFRDPFARKLAGDRGAQIAAVVCPFQISKCVKHRSLFVRIRDSQADRFR